MVFGFMTAAIGIRGVVNVTNRIMKIGREILKCSKQQQKLNNAINQYKRAQTNQINSYFQNNFNSSIFTAQAAKTNTTSIRNLFAVGECASMYHGANRLGGNSLLAAVYSANVAADAVLSRDFPASRPDFSRTLEEERGELDKGKDTDSRFPVMYIRDMAAETMNRRLGIVRDGGELSRGLEDIEYYLSVAEKINYDRSVLPYSNYSLTGMLTLAKAVLLCAAARRESRGAHFRSDFPDTDAAYGHATLISYDGGAYRVRQDTEDTYES